MRFYVDKTNKTGIKIPWDKTSVSVDVCATEERGRERECVCTGRWKTFVSWYAVLCTSKHIPHG